MTNEVFNNDPNSINLTKLVQSGELVAFLGSGLSSGLYPSWSSLVREFCLKCKISFKGSLGEDTPVEYLIDLSERAIKADRLSFEEVLHEHFSKPIVNKKLAYELLMEMPFRSYVTVNIDPLLAEEIRRSVYQTRRLFKYPDIKTKYLIEQNVFYLHGYIAPGSTPKPDRLVLTKGSFERAYSLADGILVTFWDVLLAEYPVLFLGCGLREPEIQMMLRRCKKRKIILNKGQGIPQPPLFILRPAYFLLDQSLDKRERDNDREAREQEEFSDFDVRIVRYDRIDNNHSGLLEIFNYWNPRSPIEEYNTNKEAWVPYG